MINKKILASLMVIGLAGAAATSGTLAYFSDTEASTGNSFTAGAVDLKIDWTESYNGELVEDQGLVDNPGPIFDLGDVKPGDEGEATISFHINDNPSWLWMRTELTENDENTVNEPEADADGENNELSETEIDGDGELADAIKVRLWYDDYSDSETERGDNVYQENEEDIIFGGEVCESSDGDATELDVALTLDRSGSMSGSKLSNAKSGAKILVDDLSSSDQSAAISFADLASVDQGLTTDKQDVKDAIDSLSAGGSTNMSGGISTSHNELNQNGRSSADQIMVLLSDGVPDDEQDSRDAATAAKNDGIRVITIAYGSGADEALMEDLATSPDDAYVADTDDIDQIFADIGEDIEECDAATLADLTSQLEGQGIQLDGDTSTNGKQAFGPQTHYIGFKWWIPSDTGNQIQTDSVEFNMEFYAEQERNNPNPENPWATS